MKGNELAEYELEDEIWRLRVQNKSYREIAEIINERCGEHIISHTTVAKIVNDRLKQMVVPHVEQYRFEQTEKLNLLESCYWPKAEMGDYGAGQMILKIIDQRAKLWALNLNANDGSSLRSPIEALVERLYAVNTDLSVISTDDLENEVRKRKAIGSGPDTDGESE